MLKKVLIVFSILILILGTFYFLNFYLKKNIKNTNLYGKASIKTSSESTLYKKIDRDKEIWKRDPFYQKTNAIELKQTKTILDEELNLNIEAIITGEKNYAIVNGKIIKVGDRIGGYKVESISKHKIIFSKDKTKKEVHIY